ncbi:MAG: LuxR C-terminal-related transcriptional regulator [Pseudonocardiaceae bacterium]
MTSRRRIEDPLTRLTPYQRRILALVAEGHSNLGIAQHLDCKISNVEQHHLARRAFSRLSGVKDVLITPLSLLNAAPDMVWVAALNDVGGRRRAKR